MISLIVFPVLLLLNFIKANKDSTQVLGQHHNFLAHWNHLNIHCLNCGTFKSSPYACTGFFYIVKAAFISSLNIIETCLETKERRGLSLSDVTKAKQFCSHSWDSFLSTAVLLLIKLTTLDNSPVKLCIWCYQAA